jgi:hypothetical protein
MRTQNTLVIVGGAVRKPSTKQNIKGEVKVPLWLPLEIRDELQALADADERRLNFVTQKLLLRGLAAFKRDGLWGEPSG